MKRVLTGLGLAFLMSVNAIAQDVLACARLVDDVATQASNACATLDGNTACVGAGEAVLDGMTLGAGGVFTLDQASELRASDVDVTAGTLGMLLMRLSAGLPEEGVTAVLFGGATLTNASASVENVVSLEVSNSAGYDVNLRAGAGTNFATVGTLGRREAAFVDGKSADGKWYRIVTNVVTAWVSASLVSVKGDVSTLPVLDNPYTEPFQAFVLETFGASDDCSENVSGLLLAWDGEATAKLNANGAELTFNSATLLLRANVNDGISVQVLRGTVGVATPQGRVEANGGQSVLISVGTDGMANATPRTQDRYAFASVVGAPLSLLGEDVSCIVGLPSNAQAVETRGGPGSAYSTLASLRNSEHYGVVGTFTADDGTVWYKLENNRWVLANSVATLGLCSSLANVEAPVIRQTGASSSTSFAGSEFAPQSNTRYQAFSGQDVMTGQCSTPAIATCDHLAVIVPNNDGTLGWRGQEPIIYTLRPQGGNRYLYVGRNYVNNAALTLDLTFISATEWTMTMTTVFDSDPSCNHTFYYSAYALN
jgi:uncharacterized protein YraI